MPLCHQCCGDGNMHTAAQKATWVLCGTYLEQNVVYSFIEEMFPEEPHVPGTELGTGDR